MALLSQLFLGGGLFLGASLFHLGILALIAGLMRKTNGITWRTATFLFLVIGASHIAQIGLWALVFDLTGALSGVDDALYFALITYTTVGYGDVLLDPGHRILGALSAFAGILNFGMSTALLVSLFSRVLQQE